MENAAAPSRRTTGHLHRSALHGLSGGTEIQTLNGPIPVEFLRPGNRIVTRDAGVQVLCGVRVTRHEAAAQVTIRASSLGHARPRRDLVVAPGQLILVCDWRAPELWGVARALVPALRLTDGRHVVEQAPRDFRAFELIFDAPHLVYAEAAELAMTTGTADFAG